MTNLIKGIIIGLSIGAILIIRNKALKTKQEDMQTKLRKSYSGDFEYIENFS